MALPSSTGSSSSTDWMDFSGGPAEGGSGGRQALVPLLPGRRTAGARLSGAEVPGGDWSGAGGELPSSGGTDWVEQADRAFRRDSRRYDGGFYLY